jgi:hypothetical protein
MNLQRILILAGFLCLPFMSSGQRIWDGEYNRLGLQAGVNHFTIQTSELDRRIYHLGFFLQ